MHAGITQDFIPNRFSILVGTPNQVLNGVWRPIPKVFRHLPTIFPLYTTQKTTGIPFCLCPSILPEKTLTNAIPKVFKLRRTTLDNIARKHHFLTLIHHPPPYPSG